MNAEKRPGTGRFTVRWVKRTRSLYQVIFSILAEHDNRNDETADLYWNGKKIKVTRKDIQTMENCCDTNR